MGSRFATAFQFLTILPLFEARRFENEDLARAMGLFPAVGLVLGGGLVFFHVLVGHRLPGPLEGVVLAGLLAWATGGFHLDGLADTVDGLAGGWTPERSLEIMKDSRVGAVGAVALVLALGAEAMALGLVTERVGWLGLVAAPAVGRAAAVFLARGSRYARPGGGLGQAYAEHLPENAAYEAALWAGVPCLLLGWRGLVSFAVVWFYVGWLETRFHERLGGITGDVLGFAVVTSEVVFLLALHVVA